MHCQGWSRGGLPAPGEKFLRGALWEVTRRRRCTLRKVVVASSGAGLSVCRESASRALLLCCSAAALLLNLRLPSKVELELNSKQNGETAKRRNGDGQPAKISGTGRRRGGKREGNHARPLRSMPPRIPG